MTKLVVVESPSKSNTIKKFLGPEYIIKATMGHICDLVKGGKDAERLGVDIENDFKPIYKVLPDKKDKIAAIVDAAKLVDEIFLASDNDREGCAISYHVLSQLKGIKVPIKRAVFNEITKSALQKAIANPIELDPNLYDAQQARRVLDRLVGFLVSPYLMNNLGPNLSAGRVQSVALRLIVDREREIKAFVPEEYWSVTATLAKPTKKNDWFHSKYPSKITDKVLAEKVTEDLRKSTFTVTDIEAKEQKRNPYPPFTTSKLQQAAAGVYKFAAARTMKAAQSLYENGHITYLRSDSVRSSPESIQEVREWIKANGHDLPTSPNTFKNKDSSQDAHEAIRPTHTEVLPANLNIPGDDDQKKIYKLIWERFVASQMLPALYDTMLVKIKTSEGSHELRANGRVLQYPGWLAITGDFTDDDSKDVKLPQLKVGDDLILVPPRIKLDKKETQPPSRYTDGSIINELEKRGIGRPSTFAAILSKISDKAYATKEKNQYTPTEIGCQIVDVLKTHFSFMNYEYTKEMEDKLDLIADGKLKYVDMMKSFFVPFKEELRKAQTAAHKDGGHDCDKCGKRMILKHSKFGFFIGCSGYPECKNAIGVEVDGENIVIREKHELIPNLTCPKCSKGMIKRDGQYGPYFSCEDKKCKGTRKVPFGKKCSECNNELWIYMGSKEPVLFCMGYPNCKHSEKPPAGYVAADPKKIVPKKLPHKVKRHIGVQ